MRAQMRAAASGLFLLTLCGCSKTPPDFPTPPASAGPALPVSAAARAGETSVPAAASVFTPARAASADPSAGRSNNSMNATQESTAMPMPGQNNDHSAPLGPAKPASSPTTR
jgi:hypothetical protein